MIKSTFRNKLKFSLEKIFVLVILLNPILGIPAFSTATTIKSKIGRYNVIWNSPSKDASGVMPIGNGDIAAGVYALEDGNMNLLLSKNDAYTYCGDIFKTGRVRISMKPNPFTKDKSYKQTLDLVNGSVNIKTEEVTLRIWADANQPVYHIEINSEREMFLEARPEFWKRFLTCGYNNFDATNSNSQQSYYEEPVQDVCLERNGNIIWYYSVGDHSVFSDDMRFYGVEESKDEFQDPYLHNTFGNLLKCPDLKLKNGSLSGKGKHFDIRIYSLTKQTPDIFEWIEEIEQLAAKETDTAKDWKRHRDWWSDFWNRSWIVVSDNTLPENEREKFNGEGYTTYRSEKDGGALAAQSYNVFRYIMACQSRGRVQAKFNGGLFTQQLRCDSNTWGRKILIHQPDGTFLSHEDDRDWGRRFTYQNQRLLYWPLLMSGDYDLMKPFFNYYFHLLPVRKAITKAWFGHEGAYYRENIEPTGAERDCGKEGKPPKTKPGENFGKGYYHSYYFTSGLETLAMMIDFTNHTGDNNFRDSVLVPFAREVLLFFDKHYPRDASGKIQLDPSMVLETWWIAVNPATDVSGLQFCLSELLKMNAGTREDQEKWQRFLNEVPPVYLHEIDGRKAIAPAKKWEMKMNAENGELYPVFPFRCFGLGRGNADIVEWTMENRTSVNSFNYKCWTQDQIHWAFAGAAQKAKEGLIHRFRHASEQCRFPLYGSQSPDSCPDFDHFGAGSIALQRMLVQEVDNKILLLPAWPSDWDAGFKLHLNYGTVISGVVKDGKLLDWKITPSSRRGDVVVYEPQKMDEQVSN